MDASLKEYARCFYGTSETCSERRAFALGGLTRSAICCRWSANCVRRTPALAITAKGTTVSVGAFTSSLLSPHPILPVPHTTPNYSFVSRSVPVVC